MSRTLIAGCAVVLGLLAWILVILVSADKHRSQINPSSFYRIEKGMSEEQVNAILGGPERDDTNGEYYPGRTVIILIGGSTTRSWIGRDGFIQVAFTKDGRACDMRFMNVVPNRPPTPAVRIKAFVARVLGWTRPEVPVVEEAVTVEDGEEGTK